MTLTSGNVWGNKELLSNMKDNLKKTTYININSLSPSPSPSPSPSSSTLQSLQSYSKNNKTKTKTISKNNISPIFLKYNRHTYNNYDDDNDDDYEDDYEDEFKFASRNNPNDKINNYNNLDDDSDYEYGDLNNSGRITGDTYSNKFGYI